MLYAAGGVLVALVTGFFGFLAVRRRTSGGIRTSEAVSLWAESSRIRQELRDEVVAIRGELAACEALSTARALEVGCLRSEVAALTRRLNG